MVYEIASRDMKTLFTKARPSRTFSIATHQIAIQTRQIAIETRQDTEMLILFAEAVLRLVAEFPVKMPAKGSLEAPSEKPIWSY